MCIRDSTSVNFDRSGFQRDVNVVFPIDRLRELQSEGVVSSLASFHYAFNGAYMEPDAYRPNADEVAGLLKNDAVDTVLLVPV